MLQKAVTKQSSSRVCYPCQVNTIFVQLGSVLKKYIAIQQTSQKREGVPVQLGHLYCTKCTLMWDFSTSKEQNHKKMYIFNGKKQLAYLNILHKS